MNGKKKYSFWRDHFWDRLVFILGAMGSLAFLILFHFYLNDDFVLRSFGIDLALSLIVITLFITCVIGFFMPEKHFCDTCGDTYLLYFSRDNRTCSKCAKKLKLKGDR